MTTIATADTRIATARRKAHREAQRIEAALTELCAAVKALTALPNEAAPRVRGVIVGRVGYLLAYEADLRDLRSHPDLLVRQPLTEVFA